MPIVFRLAIFLGLWWAAASGWAAEPPRWLMRQLIASDQPAFQLHDGQRVVTLPRAWIVQAIGITDRLADTLGMARPEMVVDSGSSPNAFATVLQNDTPVVGINLPMFELAAGREDYLATVIGHELGHLKANHSRHRQDDRAVVGLLSILAGVAIDVAAGRRGIHTGGLGTRTAVIGGGLVLAKFSRDQEREADEIGLRAMAAAGFRIEAASHLWRDMGSGGSGLWQSTHPSNEERVATLTQLAYSIRYPTTAVATVRTTPSTSALLGPPISGGAMTPPVALAPSPSPPSFPAGPPISGWAMHESPGKPSQVAPPPNAVPFIDGPGWACVPGYAREGDGCVKAKAAPAQLVCASDHVAYEGRLCVPLLKR